MLVAQIGVEGGFTREVNPRLERKRRAFVWLAGSTSAPRVEARTSALHYRDGLRRRRPRAFV